MMGGLGQVMMVGSLVVGVMMSLLLTGVDSQNNTPTPTQPVLVVTSFLEAPYLFAENDGSADKLVYSGFIKDLLDRISELAGFSYKLSITANSDFGTKYSNGSWSGMIGDLITRRADIAAAPLTVTHDRSRVVDFAVPFQSFARVAIVKRWPKPTNTGLSLGFRLGQLLSPLEDSIWLLSGMAWFVSSLVLYLICRVNPYEWRRMVMDREATLREGESFNCVNSYWFMLGAIFWQGFMRNPRSMGARIVVTFWWIYALIFVSMYIASLTNYLRVGPYPTVAQKQYTRIQTLQDIADNENIKVGVMKGGSTASLMKNSVNRNDVKLWARVTYGKTFENTVAVGIEKVRQSTREDPYVFMAESAMAEYFMRRPHCDLYAIRDFHTPGIYAFAFPIQSVMLNVVNFAILQLKESGELAMIESKWFTDDACKADLEDASREENVVQHSDFHKVDLASFSGALIVLIIGLALGSLVTLFEILIFKYAEKDGHEKTQEKRLMKDQRNLDKGNQGMPSDSSQPMTDV